MDEIIYFELNDWSTDYHPDAEPFLSWMHDCYKTPEEEAKSWIRDPEIMDEWFKENNLCVVISMYDMSVNFCVTAPRSWVEMVCPTLLTEYTDFIRTPDEHGDVEGYFGGHFVPWSKENCGVWYDYERTDNQGYDYYELRKLKNN